MYKVCSLLVIVSLLLVKATLACVSLTDVKEGVFKDYLFQNGYNITLSDVGKCDGSAGLVRLSDNFNLKLTKNCLVVPSGCIYFKDLDSGLMGVDIKQHGTTLSNDLVNLCSYEPMVTCPIDSGKLCLTRDFTRDISQIRQYLGSMVGTYDIKYTFYHKEKTSCVKFKSHLELASS